MRRVLAFLVGLILVAGCSLGEVLADHGDPVDLRAPGLIGVWQSGPRRAFEFREDGTFVAVDLPAEAYGDFLPVGFDPARDQLGGSGRWTITPPARDGLSSAVELTFDRFAGEQAAMGGSLDVLRNGAAVRLYLFYVGSGGNSWTSYEKCAACP